MTENIISTLEIEPPINKITSPQNLEGFGSLVAVDLEARNITKLEIDNPEVSVIFVARNEDEWLKKSLDSLYHTQNDTSYEAIVFDDFSTDNCATSIAVHNIYAASSSPVGPARARNLGAIHSRGKYLIFCDSHLKFKDHWIDDLIAPIKDGRCEAVNPIISDIAVPATKGFGWDFDLKTYNFKWANPASEFAYRPGVAGGCFAIDREVFFNVGMFDRKFLKWGSEDSELGLRLTLSGYRIGIEPKVDVGHFFKEINEYGIDWHSLNYNFLRMAYVNMEEEDIKYVYSIIGGTEEEKQKLMDLVVETSKYRKKFCDAIRKMPFSEFKQRFGRYM